MGKQAEIARDYDDAQVAFNWAQTMTDGEIPGFTITALECHVDNIERVEKAQEKLAKIAQRHGQPAPVVVFSPTKYVAEYRTSEWADGEEVCRTRKVTNCQLVVIAPPVLGFGGWRLVAVKTILGDEGVVATLPGEVIPDELRAVFYNGGAFCAHCGTQRKRNEVFIVRNDGTNTFVQVGRQCLREYTGIDPELPLSAAAFYKATGEANVGSRYEEDLLPYLAWVALVVRQDGRYWSKAAADDASSASYEREGSYRCVTQHSTVDSVGHRQWAHDQDKNEPAPTDEDRALAEAVVAYVGTLDAQMSQYAANLQAVYRAGILIWKHRGLVASAFAGYLREQERMADAARVRAQVRPSRYLGAQGDKVLRLPCRIVHVGSTDGVYGTTHIYRFVTPEGDKVTWFSSNDLDLEVGKDVLLSGTIKKLEEYRSEQQTVLTRCKIG